MRLMRFMAAVGIVACAAVAQQQETAAWSQGLTDRELAIQRWFSALTFLQDRAVHPWPEYYDDGKQLDTTGFRYQLAFAGYACALFAAQTPAYRELCEKQLFDLCERIIDRRVWFYVTHYWDYRQDPPDPCLYENVMYTGHLTQLMGLYELLTGDLRYSEQGWDFVWKDGRKVHYTLEKAIQRMHVQSMNNPNGGICCEPGLIFVDCNTHSANSFLLFDTVHGTGYAAANAKWFDWMSTNFRNKIPLTSAFFTVIYKQNLGLFIPMGDPGADAWALGWGTPWFPSMDLVKKGWEHTVRKATWLTPQPDQTYVRNSTAINCCGGGTLPVSNSFIPLLAVQVEGAASPTAQKMLRWFEVNYGRAVDLDNDGYSEGYCYQTCAKHRIPATANLAAALATDGESMRHLFRTPRKDMLAAPALAHVDYPNVCIRSAEYRAPILRFTILKGKPSFTETTELVCEQCPPPVTITRDGQPYDAVKQTGTTVAIRTDLEREHVFELTTSREN